MQQENSSTHILWKAIVCSGIRLGLLQGWLPFIMLAAARYARWELDMFDFGYLVAPFFLGALVMSVLVLSRPAQPVEFEMMFVYTLGAIAGCALLCLPSSDPFALHAFWAMSSALLGACSLRCVLSWVHDAKNSNSREAAVSIFIGCGLWAISASACIYLSASYELAALLTTAGFICSFALWTIMRTRLHEARRRALSSDADSTSAANDASVRANTEFLTCENPSFEGGSAPLERRSSRKALFRAACSLAVLGLTFSVMVANFMLAQHGHAGKYISVTFPAGIALGGALLLIAVRMRPGKSAVFAYRLLAIPVIVAFFPMDPGSTFSLHFAFFFTFTALACALPIVLLLADGYARLWNLPCVTVAAAMGAGLSFGCLIGCFWPLMRAALGLTSSTLSITATSVVLIIGCVIATNFMLRTPATSLGPESANISPQALAAKADPQQFGSIAERCHAAAQRYALTRRETEVLELLAQGHSLPYVQGELHISEGTAISHRRSIYKKMLVHGKDELIVAVNAAAGEVASQNDNGKER
ncbi:helix-turn-helix transcriptional regulator [Adlercreutzia sp. R21]|uniref:helix-turn-helix transcriptional regulator n=1 Tax=Adlercreutzia wanghongyangiae TaxID=3111451 RepID=UPI002DBEC562|nr:helix-turn-helix transcriptional regulator [Adlercreutzia sp. R21]MEC4185417.1 helix-turn-helix transcriptional regulator [Adlercreutzia sp. R21]